LIRSPSFSFVTMVRETTAHIGQLRSLEPALARRLAVLTETLTAAQARLTALDAQTAALPALGQAFNESVRLEALGQRNAAQETLTHAEGALRDCRDRLAVALRQALAAIGPIAP
jgi:CHASE3 domain sensor protein